MQSQGRGQGCDVWGQLAKTKGLLRDSTSWLDKTRALTPSPTLHAATAKGAGEPQPLANVLVRRRPRYVQKAIKQRWEDSSVTTPCGPVWPGHQAIVQSHPPASKREEGEIKTLRRNGGWRSSPSPSHAKSPEITTGGWVMSQSVASDASVRRACGAAANFVQVAGCQTADQWLTLARLQVTKVRPRSMSLRPGVVQEQKPPARGRWGGGAER